MHRSIALPARQLRRCQTPQLHNLYETHDLLCPAAMPKLSGRHGREDVHPRLDRPWEYKEVPWAFDLDVLRKEKHAKYRTNYISD